MEKDNEKLVIVTLVGLVTLGVCMYLFHKAEMKEIRDGVRYIENSNEQLVCEIRGDCEDLSLDDILDF